MAGSNSLDRVKKSIEKALVSMEKERDEKEFKRKLQFIGSATKYLAVLLKMSEGEWGSDLTKLDEGGEMDDDAETDS